MRIRSIEALVIRVPENRDVAGCAKVLLARVATDAGLTGWGESQAFTTPEVAGAIVRTILKPALEGKEFEGTGIEIESLWNGMYSQMRACGETGGFMLDAIAAVDIALWDLAGKIHGLPIAALIAGGGTKTRLESYVHHLPGETLDARLESARSYRAAGNRRFRIAHDGSARDLLDGYDALAEVCGSANIAVDALGRLDPASALRMGHELDRRGAMWLERPLASEDPARYAAVTAQLRTPVAMGTGYRTHAGLAPFFRAAAMRMVRPDVGRCGITEALRIAHAAERAGMDVVPHLTGGLGPLLFATLQFAAAVPNCPMVPHAPPLLETAAGFSTGAVEFRDGSYSVPVGPGLGVECAEPEVHLVDVA